MEFHETIQHYPEAPLTKQILMPLLKDYKRPYDKINELVKQDMLIPVKRGIFVPGPRLRMRGPESFLLANHIQGPSYISLETALEFWSMIPERVYEIASMTIAENRIYRTRVGRFSYRHLPLPYYSFGIRQLRMTELQTVMIASPEKALCDKIVATSGVLLRSVKQCRDFLMEDMRIDEDELLKLDTAEISTWLNDSPKKDSLSILIKTLKTL